MRRRIPAGLAGFTMLMSAAVASAALGVAPAGLVAGSAPAVTCDPDGLRTTFTTTFGAAGYTITEVVVSGIDVSGCRDLGLDVTLTDSDGRPLGDGAVTVGGSSMAVPIFPAVPAASVSRVHAFIGV
jgi:hypothetical protein